MRANTTLFSIVLLVLFSLAILPGCSFISGTPTGPGVTTTTAPSPEIVKSRQDTAVRLASSLATKAALIAVNDDHTTETATLINTVASAIVKATDNNQLDLTQVRVMAAKAVADAQGSTKQKLIASQLVDTIGLLVQSRVDSDLSGLSDTDKRVRVIGLIRAAALGATDATAIFVTQ